MKYIYQTTKSSINLSSYFRGGHSGSFRKSRRRHESLVDWLEGLVDGLADPVDRISMDVN